MEVVITYMGHESLSLSPPLNVWENIKIDKITYLFNVFLTFRQFPGALLKSKK